MRKNEKLRLTPRQMEILCLMAVQALTYREIADVLGIAEQTVKNHMQRAFDRAGVRDRLGLALIALEKGWIDPPRPLSSFRRPRRSSRFVGKAL